VFVANQRLFVRSLDDVEARPLTGTDGFALVTTPKFSPDGASIIFWSSTGASGVGTWKKIAASGGVPMTLAQTAFPPYGVSWVGDVFVWGEGANGIMRAGQDGGAAERVVEVTNSEAAGNPHLLPGGNVVLFSLANRTAGGVSETRIVAQSLETGRRTTLVPKASDGRYLATGHLLYVSDGVALAAPFDVDRVAITGGATPVIEGVRMGNGRAQLAISDTGTLVYVPGPITAGITGWKVARVSRQGGITVLPIPPSAFSSVRMSRDGQRLALGSNDGKEAVVSIYDIGSAARPRRLTFHGRNQYPVWSDDGEYVAFQSDRDGDVAVFRQRANGSGVAERLTRPESGAVHTPEFWSPDGSRLLYSVTKDDRTTLWSLTLSDRRAVPLSAITSPATSLPGVTLSHDGRWMAYTSREGRTTSAVFVQPFPPTGTPYQISRDEDDGHHPVWSGDSRELIFTPGSGTRISVVPVTLGSSFSFGAETVLLRPFRNSVPSTVRTYDVAGNGDFIALVDPATDDTSGTTDRLRVVLNWTEQVSRRVPVR